MSQRNQETSINSSTNGSKNRSKRLYKLIKDQIKILDEKTKSHRSLVSLFQPEQTRLRQKIRDSCEKLLLLHPSDLSKKAEEVMWRNVFYDVIQAVKGKRKLQSDGSVSNQHRDLVAHYKQFLDSATGYYQHLLLKIQEICPGLVDVDYPLMAGPFYNTSRLSRNHGIQDFGVKETEDWVRIISYRLLMCLGDLSRYQMEFYDSESRAKRFYQMASLAKPNIGFPYNQLAALSGCTRWWGLTATFYYHCALQAETINDSAENNLQVLFTKNKQKYFQLADDALETVASTQLHKSKQTEVFIISFLYLCELLKPKSSANEHELIDLCGRLIVALPSCLANCRQQASSFEGSQLDLSDNVEVNSNASQNSTFYLTINEVEKSAEAHQVDEFLQLTDESIFHITIISLINLHEQQTRKSEKLPVAISFYIGLFTHLANHLLLISTEDANNPEEINFADGDSRKRLSPSRIRRRRRLTEERKGSEEYHSEDSLGAGDADVEDSEDDISSSPEEMSSQDEEFSETLRSINSKTRQIVLAPSFNIPLKDDLTSDDSVLMTSSSLGLLDKQSEKAVKRLEDDFSCFQRLLGRNQLFASFKLLADWLIINRDVIASCADSARALFFHLTALANRLPDESQMLLEVKSDLASDSPLLAQLQATDDVEDWMQEVKLPEDEVVSNMKMIVERDRSKLRDDVDTNFDLCDVTQLMVRICCLRHLCRQFVEIEECEVKWSRAHHKFEARQSNTVDCYKLVQGINNIRKNHQMKEMASLRLRNQVQSLENSINVQTALCLYIVPDVSALCHDLVTIRRIVASGRFLLIVSKTVIDGLDSIKKDSQSARDAIRFIDSEFERRSKLVIVTSYSNFFDAIFSELFSLKKPMK